MKLTLTDAEIKETVLFKDVTKVLEDGVALNLLKNTHERYRDTDWSWDFTLGTAFYWYLTHQGHDWWEKLCEEI
ncbi:hypothetical protein S140_125 [Shewanella sp. phage 1/40]|uniref:hypothetical protein n=1 Tax=Shewanella sp. phage 1/40 TaxID=1458860 RepID=UPI0004F5FB83|nr:hypothetical protein S140_125 [Shewanella sp. phage 1/40]AHK11532.1 hypothetical protein S140_125 [Shewanella sp. phage 1/40]